MSHASFMMANMRFLVVAWVGVLIACGSEVETEPAAGGGGSMSSGPTGGSSGCKTNAACGDGMLCMYATGECAPACSKEACDTCSPGFVCSVCAGSACPECTDCRDACLPVQADQCDDDDACPQGELCNFNTGRCEAGCKEDFSCADSALVCDGCATGTCCSCKSCVGLCLSPAQ